MSKLYYDSLYRHISTGGESLLLTVCGKVYVFRIPTSIDYQRCLRYSEYGESQETFLLAVCLSEVGGVDVPDNLRFSVVKEIESLPKFKQRLIPHFWKSVEDSNELSKFFEAFCYTPASRYLWKKWLHACRFGIKIQSFRTPELTEIHMQWIGYNELEDEKEDIDERWSRAFFQASAMNPKGVEKVQKEWNKRKKREEEYRKKVLERAEQGLVEESDEDKYHSKSVSQLQEEYKNWVDGVEDDHDKRIREYKERLNRFIKNGRSLKDRQQEDLEDMNSNLSELNSLSINTPLKAFSDSEIERLLSEKSRNTIQIDEGEEYDNLLSNKYLNAKEVIKESSPSLMDQVSKRKLPTIEG